MPHYPVSCHESAWQSTKIWVCSTVNLPDYPSYNMATATVCSQSICHKNMLSMWQLTQCVHSLFATEICYPYGNWHSWCADWLPSSAIGCWNCSDYRFTTLDHSYSVATITIIQEKLVATWKSMFVETIIVIQEISCHMEKHVCGNYHSHSGN